MAGGEGSEWGAKTVTAEQPPIGRGGWRQRGDRCCGDDRCLNDYNDYTNRGAGKDDAPLEDGRRKRIRRMGNKCCKVTLFFGKSFLVGTLCKICSHTHSSILSNTSGA